MMDRNDLRTMLQNTSPISTQPIWLAGEEWFVATFTIDGQEYNCAFHGRVAVLEKTPAAQAQGGQP